MNNLEAARALAEADFTGIAERFATAGLNIRLPAKGILQVRSQRAAGKRLRVLLSVGIHGDETAPIEMLAQLLAELSQQPEELHADLMVAVGNLEAITLGKRFVDADLNRLFADDRGDLHATAEAKRADLLMRATAEFFGADGGEKWHLDLHTAIRPSHYPTFAVIPVGVAERRKQDLAAWLGGAGIGAIILNTKPATTYSAYTANRFGASACTVELGQVGVLGQNRPGQFALTAAAIDTMLRCGEILAFRRVAPAVFHVVQEIVKRSDDFQLHVDAATPNFTVLEPGALIARDAVSTYHVGTVPEYVVFPNPDVRIGQRAGLMVVQRTAKTRP